MASAGSASPVLRASVRIPHASCSFLPCSSGRAFRKGANISLDFLGSRSFLSGLPADAGDVLCGLHPQGSWSGIGRTGPRVLPMDRCGLAPPRARIVSCSTGLLHVRAAKLGRLWAADIPAGCFDCACSTSLSLSSSPWQWMQIEPFLSPALRHNTSFFSRLVGAMLEHVFG